MNTFPWASIGLVALFIVISGAFSATEFALISLRESQIDQIEERGKRGRRVASVARDPNRFLAALQIGTTVTAILSGAYGSAALSPAVEPVLVRMGMHPDAAGTVSLIVLTLIIAYVSLVIGELAPKRFALQRAEALAWATGPTVDRFASIMRPFIKILSGSANLIVKLLGGDPHARAEEIDEQELRILIEGQDQLAPDERRILSDVLAAGSRTIVEAMTPRGEVAFLAASLTLTQAAQAVRDKPFSRYPVTGRGFDDVLGFVHVRDILQPPDGSDPETTRVHALMRPMLALPGTNRAIESMSRMRNAGAQIAIVVDEYGGTDGIVALEDLVEELIGDIRDEFDRPAPVHAAGTYDAGLTIEEFARRSGVSLSDGPYETVAGYILTSLGRLAQVGDVVAVPGTATIEEDDDDLPEAATITVTEVEGRRIRAISLS